MDLGSSVAPKLFEVSSICPCQKNPQLFSALVVVEVIDMSLETQKTVLKVIAGAPLPVSIDYIAKRVGIGWGTAIRYALELVIAGKIEGMKTTRGWTFWGKDSA